MGLVAYHLVEVQTFSQTMGSSSNKVERVSLTLCRTDGPHILLFLGQLHKVGSVLAAQILGRMQ